MGTPHYRLAVHSLGRGTTWMVLGTLSLLLLNLVGRVYAARHLTVAQFGNFNLGLAFAGLLALVALLGLHQAMARTLAEDRDPAVRRRVVRWAGTVTALTGVASSVLVFLLAGSIASLFDPSGSAELTLVFQMFSVTVGLTLLCTFLASIFQGFEDTVPNAWINQTVQPASFVLFLFLLLALHLSLPGVLLAWVLSNVVTFVALLAFTLRRLPRYLPPGPVSPTLPKGLWTLSLALWGISTLTFATAYVDTLVLAVFRPEFQVGLYAAVMTLARLVLVVGAAVTYIFLPVASRLSGQGQAEALGQVFTTATRWMMVVTLPVFFILALLPGPSIREVFGVAYLPAAGALAVITAGAFASILFGPVNGALAGLGATRPLLIATGISALANLVLSLALIPLLGLLGAALAWTLARVLYPGSSAYFLYTTYGIHPFRRTLWLPLTLSLAVGLPLFVALSLLEAPPWSVFPLYFLGLGVAVGAVLVTRTAEEGDLVLCDLAEQALRQPLPRLRRLLERSGAGSEGGETHAP